LPLSRGVLIGRSVLDRQTLQVADLQAEAIDYPEGSEFARRLGHRTILAVPLIRGREASGAIFIRRTVVRPFTQRQIDLVQTFADQAVIAIENARLFEAEHARTAELKESLEYQTATAVVLNVISRSPTQLQPVLNAIIATAGRLCEADYAHCRLEREGRYHVMARHALNPDEVESVPGMPVIADRTSVTGKVVTECRTIHVPDVMADPEDTYAVNVGTPARTILGVPLVRNGKAVGVVVLFRKHVRPFTDRQIDLVTTFAEQAVIAIENTRLFEAEQASKRELQQSLEYQTATSEVLSVISRSPSNLQPVLDVIVETAVRLCQADAADFRLLRDGAYHIAATTVNEPTRLRTLRDSPIAPGRSSVVGRVALERRTVHVPDIDADPEYSYAPGPNAPGMRAILGVPLLRGNEVIGAIVLFNSIVKPFTQEQIALVGTFANQALIAIENARLFEAEQASKRELQESLQYQTATAEVLSVISRFPNQLQPVLDAITQTAARLCQADYAHFRLLRDGAYHVVSSNDYDPVTLKRLTPIAPGPGSIAGRVALEGKTIHLPDILAEATGDYTRRHGEVARTGLGVPLLKDQTVVGVIMLFRKAVHPFTERQIALVNTFAEQALIAMENTRLFEEVQARNTDLRVALEQQTATSELLKVIGQSTFDLQPVFETLAENAVRLCAAERAFIFRFDGQVLRAVASHNVSSELRAFVEQHPMVPGRSSATARAAAERRTVQVHDAQADPEYTYASRQVDPIGTIIAIPMLLAGELLGVITIYRHEVLPFTDGQISLLETFADQAAIAIENTRLFEEVQARNRDLTALGDVGRAVSSTLDLRMVLKTIVDRAVDLSGTDAGSIFYFREELGRFELGETSGLEREVAAKYRKLDIVEGQTGLGEAIVKRQPLQVPDVLKRPSNALRDAALEAGLHAALIVPLLGSEGALGALVLQRRRIGEFPPSVVSLMQSFADQSAIALENARLFEEIAQKSRELEIASQHKSQFVANMSHELRTPLAAILGYAELMQEGFYGGQSEKSMDALTRIRSNGKHLLGLINTVLDIAKIESGQFTLNMAEYAIESVVETVRSATESLAQTKKLALKTEVAMPLPIGVGDEQRLTQVLLNLVGNAIKFTDIGEVRVTAKAVDGHFAVSVVDTGPGIPEEHQARIFDQFHQVDSSNTKAKGGTGLGLAIAKQIVEMHGGRIWVESILGKGSTFQMELPTRAKLC
jgi:GAF domain-containing protein